MKRYIVRIMFNDRERAEMEIFAEDATTAVKKAYSTIPPEIEKHIVTHEVSIAYQNYFDPK